LYSPKTLKPGYGLLYGKVRNGYLAISLQFLLKKVCLRSVKFREFQETLRFTDP